MRVAVLGMGRMGHALAERLLAGGHILTVWNRTQGKADDLLARGALQAATPAEAAAASELTLTSLADDSAVRSVVDGAGRRCRRPRRRRAGGRQHRLPTDDDAAQRRGVGPVPRLADTRLTDGRAGR